LEYRSLSLRAREKPRHDTPHISENRDKVQGTNEQEADEMEAELERFAQEIKASQTTRR
jgi:hypothetical protein